MARVRKPTVKGQVVNVFLTMDERLLLRSHLNAAKQGGLDDAKKNTRALEALEAGETLELGSDVSREDAEKFLADLTAKVNSKEETPIVMTVENATHILSVLERNLKDAELNTRTRLNLTSGSAVRNLMEAVERLEAVKDGKEIPGAVEKLAVVPESDTSLS